MRFARGAINVLGNYAKIADVPFTQFQDMIAQGVPRLLSCGGIDLSCC
ncbi:MAG: hypothetical protein AAF848_11220 [Pseudomonadota bacterium]